MNYLGLIGLLGLTGERGGPPMQAAGQIADLGGGALMAAFGIMAALRERDGSPGRPGSGEGQFVDVSMADGALSWLAMVAGSYFADGNIPRRGDLPLAGSLVCYRPYECSDGWVSLGALEPKFWQAFCRGVQREDLIPRQFEGPGSEAHGAVQEIFAARTRADWEQFAREHDCCLEPVLELDEALSSELVREREMVVEIEQPGAAQPVRQLGRAGQARPHARRPRQAPRPRARRAHRGGAGRSRLLRGRGPGAAGQRRGRRAGPGAQRPDAARVRARVRRAEAPGALRRRRGRAARRPPQRGGPAAARRTSSARSGCCV